MIHGRGLEPLYDSLLATVTAPSASSKHKTIELHNPSVPVELKHTGTLYVDLFLPHMFDLLTRLQYVPMDIQMGRVRAPAICFLELIARILNVPPILVHSRHEFEWKREECFLIRKPDPPVLVAITKEPPGRIKTKAVQILDYNLKR